MDLFNFGSGIKPDPLGETIKLYGIRERVCNIVKVLEGIISFLEIGSNRECIFQTFQVLMVMSSPIDLLVELFGF